MKCNCENSGCKVGHVVEVASGIKFVPCPNSASVPCKYVGEICAECARYMDTEYLKVNSLRAAPKARK